MGRMVMVARLPNSETPPVAAIRDFKKNLACLLPESDPLNK